MMNEEIFRKKNLDKVKSPENLDDYIRVSNPGVWLLLISVIVLLAGACVWGFLGRIDSTVPTTVRVENGEIDCYIAEDAISSVQAGMTVKFSDFEAVITEITDLDMMGCKCALQSQQTVPDGAYDGKIVTGSVSPMSFVLN